MKSKEIDEPYDWAMTDKQKTARRQRLFKKHRQAEGWKRISVWVHEQHEVELRAFVERLAKRAR